MTMRSATQDVGREYDAQAAKDINRNARIARSEHFSKLRKIDGNSARAAKRYEAAATT
jgi:hypothetical protein